MSRTYDNVGLIASARRGPARNPRLQIATTETEYGLNRARASPTFIWLDNHSIKVGSVGVEEGVTMSAMDEIWTPSRRQTSADSSPANTQSNNSPQQPTPRSKIKALLAAVDNESASETDSGTHEAQHQDQSEKSVSKNPASLTPSNKEVEVESDDDDDIAPTAPRGRLAARLQGQEAPKDTQIGSEADTEEQAGGNVYERIRKQLLAKKEDRRAHRSPNISPLLSAGVEDASPLQAAKHRKSPTKSHSPTDSAIMTPVKSCEASPDLFLTPGSPSLPGSPKDSAVFNESDSELPANPQQNERFLALVARKRAEREARQIAEKEKMAAREAQSEAQIKKGSRRVEAHLDDSEEDSHDDTGVGKLTQQSRPTRKASKKALEEMNRETQRMNRNMQLAHQAKTKKRITKESLFARFNFRTTAAANLDSTQTMSSSTAVSSVPASDAENSKGHETPPSSPPHASAEAEKSAEPKIDGQSIEMSGALQEPEDVEDELPDIQDVMSQPRPKAGEGKGKAVESLPVAPGSTMGYGEPIKVHRKTKARLPHVTADFKKRDIDSDSDLEILPLTKPRKSTFDAFNRLPAQKAKETRSMQNLRALAHLNSPPGKQSGKSRPSITMSEMQMSLQQRARQQAAAERAEKIQELKNRGVVIQTSEQRQKDQVEIEDLIEKARQEAEEIKKQEKDAAKKEKKANGEGNALDDTSDEDEDDQDNPDDDEVELSGSDEDEAVPEHETNVSDKEDDSTTVEDEDEGGVGVPDADDGVGKNAFIENEAMEDSREQSSMGEDEDSDATEADEDEPNLPRQQRRPRVSRVIDSDEDEEPQTRLIQNLSQSSEAVCKPIIPVIPGLGIIDGAAVSIMGMTQAFAATMADSQTQAHDHMAIAPEQDSLSLLGPVPEPNFPVFDPNDEDSMVLDSQNASDAVGEDIQASMNITLEYSQSQIQQDTAQESQYRPSATQDDDIPDPTQDMGFGMSSPAANRFISAPPSTVETVLPAASSPSKKKRRLQRRNEVTTDLSGSRVNIPTLAPDAADLDSSANAFDVMTKKRQIAAKNKAYDKKRSEAKDMVDEQAQESEDEYAGIGGASDDESGGSEDDDVRKMIETGDIDVDEGKMAAFYADKERTRDEAAISKLYKDITSGGLRRNRGGADIDLSDSEDDAERRLQAKRRKEAKLRKALLEDERIGRIAEDPKKVAFLRAIEDREQEDGFLLDEPEQDSLHISESTQEIADSQPTEPAGPKRKRPLSDSVPDAANRPPPAARRRKGKKPSTLAEIRESVSFLIETPESASFIAETSPLQSEDENGDARHAQTDAGNEEEIDMAAMPPPSNKNPRRTGPSAFTDRLALLRSNTSASSSTRLAFAANDSSTSNSSFRVPSLLRRATTSNLASVADVNGISHLAATEQAAGGEKKSVIPKKGRRKGCSILGAAREVERQAAVKGVERRRKEERERVAKMRRDGIGRLGSAGGWEM